MYVIQKSKQIRTKTMSSDHGVRLRLLCMSFKKVNKYGLKQCADGQAPPLTVVYVIQKSKQIRTKTIVADHSRSPLRLCMSFKKVNKYGLKQWTV